MDATNTPDPTAFPAPHVPLADDGGLGYNDIARTPDAYITVQVGPWDGFQDGDTVQIRWSVAGTVVGSRAASRGDQGKRLDVFVHASDIRALGEGTHEVVARVTHAAGTTIDSSPTHIRVKMTVPGGHDTSLKTPYINEHLPAPKVSPSVITPETTAISVTIPAYPDMAAEDLILVRWNVAGNDVSHGPIEVGEVDVPVVVPIHEPTIRAGGAGDALNVSYQVFDLVHNWSLWSPRAQVEVEAPGAPTDPWVEGTVKNEGETLDVDALNNTDVEVTVRAGQVGATDTVTVHWAGTTAAGMPLAFDTEPQTPQAGKSTLTFVVPYRWVEPLAQGTARAWYTAAPADGGAERSSLQHNLSVTGTVAQLIRPSVAEAKDGTIDPADINGSVAHGLVPAWHGMQVGDIVELIGDGTPPGGSPSTLAERQEVSSTMLHDDVAFEIPREFVASLLGGHLRLHYVITPYESLSIQGAVRRFALAALDSDPLELEVRDASNVPGLPAPTVPELETGGYLDPDKHATAHVDVPAYAGIAKNDQVDLILRGGVEPYQDRMLVTSSANPPRFALRGQVIQANRGLVIDASYTVTRAGSGESVTSRSLEFGIGVPTIELPPIIIDGAVDGQLDLLPIGGLVALIPGTPVISEGDKYSIKIIGIVEKDWPLQHQECLPEGSRRPLVNHRLAAAIGSDLTFFYTVEPGNGDAFRDSPSLIFHIADIVSNDPRFTTQYITEADAGRVLDLTTFEGDPSAMLADWPLIHTDIQRYWLTAISGDESLSLVKQDRYDGAIGFTISRIWLKNMGDNSTFTLELKIAFDGVAEKKVRTFLSKPYTIRTTKPDFSGPSILEAVDGKLDGWLASATLRIPANASMKSGDIVTGYFNGQSLGAKVAAGATAIDVAISGTMIAAAQGKTVGSYYTVQRDDTPWTSLTSTVTVLTRPQFSAPVIPESSGGGLAGWLPATLRTPSNAAQEADDVVTGYFNGISLGAKQATGTSGIDFSISSTLTDAAKGRTVSCYYTVQRSDTPWASSTLTVTVLAPPQLSAPSITQDIGGGIPGGRAATLRIPANAGQASGDVVTGYFDGTSLGTNNVTGSGHIDFTISDALTSAAKGRTAEAFYDLQRGSTSWTSPILKVNVLGFPAPLIPESSNGQLYGGLSEATLTIPASAGLKYGDTVLGYFQYFTVGIEDVEVAGQIDMPVQGRMIEAARGSTVEAWYDVKRQGEEWESAKMTVEVTALLPRISFPEPSIPEMSEGELSGLLEKATLRISASAGTKMGDTVVGHFNREQIGQSVVQNSNGIDFQISGEAIVNARSRIAPTYYEVFRHGVMDSTSKVLQVKVGAGNLHFPPPAIPEMSEEELSGSLESATLRIPTSAGTKKDDIVVGYFNGKWLGKSELTDSNGKDFPISSDAIVSARSKTVDAYYLVSRHGVSDSTSDVLKVTVGAGNLYFPVPVIPQMSSGRLDGRLESATISVAVGGNMQYGDSVQVAFGEVIFSPKMAAGNVLDFYIDRSMLQVARGRRIFCFYWVTRNAYDSWESEVLVVDVT